MYRGSPSVNFSMPGDYRKAAERLFPKDGFGKGQKPDLKASGEFAKVLGIGVEYQRLLALDKNSGELRTFLDHFHNNLDLLIKKTWVEKSDETRKNALQNGIPAVIANLDKLDYLKAIEEFSSILDGLAFLFFGDQCEKEDFTEYTFRIDAQMGLFWWYGGRLALLNNDDKNAGASSEAIRGDKSFWAVLLLGLCYLTNF